MENDTPPDAAAHSGLLRTSDFIALVGIAIGTALHVIAPLPFPRFAEGFWASLPRLALGLAVATWGVSWIVRAQQALRASGQTSKPGTPTTHLITDGPFARSRNPIYLGVVLIYAGLGFIFDTVWFLILTPVLIIALTIVLIRPEERYLEITFGQAYRDWATRVRRWL